MSLSSIRARVEAATKGPWAVRDRGEELVGRVLDVVRPHVSGKSSRQPRAIILQWYDAEVPIGGRTSRDAEFIAHARTDIPLLLKVAEAARESIMWRGEVCPEWPEMKHGDCISRCGNRRVCAALAELEAGE